ncbi:related to folylpolyglutamate synthetase [Rhynchosporium agropyri]|uniref:Folylpolyglutamate synthase n=1 Tax=Rhynchosporium agropyri TaxID=914238 RepID=A0A1E1K319_9HELO|nr:related to folylpolyglutamate synthetase [Rhynchosporium agropyri]
MERSYEEAIRCLNSRKALPKPNLDDMRGSDDMIEWLELLGHPVEALNGLNAIHVAGTNGKGSTCAFAASFLQAHGNDTGYPQTIGLYTSPHMKNIRERIRINGEPISKEQFTLRFFEIWDILPEHATPTIDIPRYLQLLALLSFHVFIKEKVDVAIYETHLGGEFDATNIIRMPLVTALTPIAMDHVALLGSTIQKIAWHKAGIFKSGSRAYSTLQDPEVARVLQQRAFEKGVMLEFVGIDSALPTNTAALKPVVQRVNCSLALAVVRAWLSIKAPQKRSSMEYIIAHSINQFSWPGRYQQINERNCQWFLDGAHNEVSLRYAVDWFATTITENQNDTVTPMTILIFSQFSTRNGIALLRSVAESLKDNDIHMQYVILTTYDERRDGQIRIDRNLQKRFSADIQERYAETWSRLDPTAVVICERTIEGALDRAREIGDQNNGVQALITGSLHLVSGALYLLDSEDGIQRFCEYK